MVKMNDKMNTILKNQKEKETHAQLDAILESIVDRTKKIRDCILYDSDGSLEEEKINFTRILQFVGDWTGYEASCNELRFERKSIPQSQFLLLASRLSDMLTHKFNGRKMVVYVSLYDDEIELRFHTYRKNEGLWLNEDLNKYDIPILYWI